MCIHRTSPSLRLIARLFAAAVLLAAATPALAAGQVEISIDPSVKPRQPFLPGLAGGPEREVVSVVDPAGVSSDFVAGELLIQDPDPGALADLLARYGGELRYDGALPEDLAPGAGTVVEEGAWWAVSIQPELSEVDDLADHMAGMLDLEGEYLFSSEVALRTAAAALRERKRGLIVDLDWVFAPDAPVAEHPNGVGGNFDWERVAWMTEDDDPATAGDQGLSIGVVHAWEYLEYQGHSILDPWTTELRDLAILDNGFALDETTGEPDLGSLDYRDSTLAPRQWDFIDGDGTAGGEGAARSPWHGQRVFGVAAAYSHNEWGVAGTAARWARPMLLRVDYSALTTSPALAAAIRFGAEVVNMSFGGNCNFFCRTGYWLVDFSDRVDSAHDQHGIVLVASAGNDAMDLDHHDYWPCEHRHVVCVGATDLAGLARGFSNFDGAIDVWAPDGMNTTPDPTTIGNPEGATQLPMVTGTSYSSPFVAGVATLLKVLDRDLRGDEVAAILGATANPGADAKVARRGLVDAYRAALAARPNGAPVPRIVHPADGATLSYLPITGVLVQPGDPESDLFGHDFFGLGGTVEVSSSLDGTLCTMDDATRDCPLTRLEPGTHVLTATVTDPHGAVGSTSVTIEARDLPPTATILSPATGSTAYADQVVHLAGQAFDPEGETGIVYWESSLDGFLAGGTTVNAQLSVGAHVLTFWVYDQAQQIDSATVAIQVLPAQGIPTASIFSPAPLAASGDGWFRLTGQGLDPQDGMLPGSSLVWSSNVDGFLGTGADRSVVLSTGSCSPTAHTLTLTVTDGDGNADSASVVVWAGTVC